MKDLKLFGREPAFYVGVIEALIAVLVTFQIPGLSVEQAALWVAVVVAAGGVLTAWTTRNTLLAALVALVKALLVLVTAYGVTVSQEQIGLIAALVSTVGAGWLRTQTSPVSTPLSNPTYTHQVWTQPTLSAGGQNPAGGVVKSPPSRTW